MLTNPLVCCALCASRGLVDECGWRVPCAPAGRQWSCRTRVGVLVMFATVLFAGPVAAGPPFVTDDPEPVQFGHWEVNTAFSQTWGHGSASAAMPGIDINYGVLPGVQLHVQPRYSRERSGAERLFGIDDTEVGVKYRFFNIEKPDASLMIGVYPLLQVPTGNKKLGPGRNTIPVFLPLWIQGTSARLTVYGGAGYRVNQGPENRNSVYTGATALYKLAQRIQLGGELFHETRTTVSGAGVTGFNVGGSYSLAEDYNILFSAGRTLQSTDGNQRSVYVGLQVLR